MSEDFNSEVASFENVLAHAEIFVKTLKFQFIDFIHQKTKNRKKFLHVQFNTHSNHKSLSQ